MKEEFAVLNSIKSSAEQNLRALCEFWDVYDKQRFFISAIGIYDRLFVDSIQQKNKEAIKPFYDRIIQYSYPVFIRLFYSPEFETLPGVALKPLDEERRTLYSKLIYSCGIIGWIQSLIESVKAGYLKYTSFFKHIRITFREVYHWNEYIEQEYLTWYSETIVRLQQNEYDQLFARLEGILDKISRSVFIWRDQFMGYSTDIETEAFFNEHAYLDAKQSIDWDMFPYECLFGSVCYGEIVQAIIDFSGYSIKHIYCASTLINLHPELIDENLHICFFTEEDLTALIAKNQVTDVENAKMILDMLSLTPDNRDYFEHAKTLCAPLIKVSQHQYIRSSKGFLDGAFKFALFKLHESYRNDWDRNVNTREDVFREQLYSLFDNERFLCVPHTILIESNGEARTDIDATVIDKFTGEIALFQLKWQDPADYSSFTLRSKASNFYIQTEKWLTVVRKWLENCDEAELASKMGIKKKHVRKDKVIIFVLGRHHGNYSRFSKPNSGCAWVQWYQLLQSITYLSRQQDLSLTKIYEYLIQTNPTNLRIKEPRNTFVYGKYRIHYGGGKTKVDWLH